jgi:hypothetical protein
VKGLFRLFLFLFILVDVLIAFVWWTHPKGARKMGYSGAIPFELPFEMPYEVIVKKKGAPAADTAAPKELPNSVTAPVQTQLDRAARRASITPPSAKRVKRRRITPKHVPRKKTKEELELEEIAEDVGVALPEDKRVGLSDDESEGLLNQPFDSLE